MTTKPDFSPRVRASVLAALSIACAFASHAQTVTLPPVSVTAPRFAQDESTLPFGVSVITEDEIRASGAGTVNEALMRLLGVVGRQDLYGGGEYALDLRGFGTNADLDQVVIVDGVRMSEADLGGTRLAGIPIESVQRIEVLRGSAGVLYGEGATGGVIVITTKAGSGQPRANAASLYGAVGSDGLREGRASASVGSGGFSLDAAAQKRRSDGHRANGGSDLQAASATGQWSGDHGRVGLRIAQDELDARLPGALSTAQYAADPHQTATPDDWARIRNQRASVFGEATFADWQLALEAGHRDKALRSMNSGFAYDYDVAANSYALRARREGGIAGLRNAFVVGADFGDWQRDLLGSFGSAATQRSGALYARDELTLQGGTRVSFGARAERIRKDNAGTEIAGTQHAWELGLSHPFTPALTAFARIGRSYRLPSVDEFSYTSPGVMLVPQVSRDAELGARWAHAGGKLEARAYRSLLEHEIGYDPDAAGPFGFAGANVNFDPTRRQGIELDGSQSLTRTLGLRLNLAWREAVFRSGPSSGKAVPLVPHATAALRADWTPAPGQRLSGGLNWVSSQHPDAANACTMPSYLTADARYAYQWGPAELALGVGNLFDRKYYTQAFACAGGLATSIYPEAGRAFTASVRVQF